MKIFTSYRPGSFCIAIWACSFHTCSCPFLGYLPKNGQLHVWKLHAHNYSYTEASRLLVKIFMCAQYLDFEWGHYCTRFCDTIKQPENLVSVMIYQSGHYSDIQNEDLEKRTKPTSLQWTKTISIQGFAG